MRVYVFDIVVDLWKNSGGAAVRKNSVHEVVGPVYFFFKSYTVAKYNFFSILAFSKSNFIKCHSYARHRKVM